MRGPSDILPYVPKLDVEAITSRNRCFHWVISKQWFAGYQIAFVLAAWWLAALWATSAAGAVQTELHSHTMVFQGFIDDTFNYALMLSLIGLVLTTRRLLRRLRAFADYYDAILTQQGHGNRSQRRRRFCAAMSFIARRSRAGRLWHTLCLLVATLFVAGFQGLCVFYGWLPRGWATDPDSQPALYLLAVVWALFWMVIIVGNAFWYVLATGFQIFRFVIGPDADARLLGITPNSPDGYGGLMIIGELAFGMVGVVFCGMPCVVIWLWQFGPGIAGLVGALVFSLFLTGIFFVPLLVTHRAMADARDRELRRVAHLFKQQFDALPQPNAQQPDPTLRERLELLTSSTSYMAPLLK